MRVRNKAGMLGISMLLSMSSVAVSGCSGSGSTAAGTGAPRLAVDHAVALADEPVHLTVTGLKPGRHVSLALSEPDVGDTPWTSHATFTADAAGTVDLATQAPGPGSSYQGADAMGLFWSVTTTPANRFHGHYWPPDWPADWTVHVTATPDGGPALALDVTRRWNPSGVTARTLTLAADKVSGDLFLPPAGGPKKPGVIVFGGSEGGLSVSPTARLLAAHGYPTVALAYWHEDGLPSELKDVPLEYFVTAARLLAAQPGVDADHIIAAGYSRGTEAALLLADEFPDVFHGAVLWAPSSDVNRSYPPDSRGAAWTLAGRPVPLGPIPVDHVSGPVLAFAGTADHMWDSAPSAAAIMTALDAAGDRHPHEAKTYVGAGHDVGTFPYLPAETTGRHPVTGAAVDYGGSIPADEKAQEDSWSRLLKLLGSLES